MFSLYENHWGLVFLPLLRKIIHIILKLGISLCKGGFYLLFFIYYDFLQLFMYFLLV